jgi:hypothetical protein
MGDLRLKAQELLQIRQNEKELNEITDYIAEEKEMNIAKAKSKEIFTERIQKEINGFQKNLLESANRGEALNIEILRLDIDGLLSWWDEREDKIINTRYTPIKSGIVTFIDDINLEFLTDDIIIDGTLQKLYDLIRENDIYPQWKVRTNRDGKIEILYIEVDPTVSYNERKESIHREKSISQRSIVVQNYQQQKPIVEEEDNDNKIKRIVASFLTFVFVLYFSVLLLTIISEALGVVDNATSSFVEVGWPYFLITDFSKFGELFIFSLPLGILISIYSSYKSY